jgi:ubiquinone/menaquinone biosynthesis C-methylase UbiE
MNALQSRGSGYSISGGQAGRERLRLLSRVMAESTRALLRAVNPRPGSAWLDVGCGGGDVSVELAHRVGPRGRVVGVDMDSVKLAMARAEAAAQGLAQIEYRQGDALHGLPAGPFDGLYDGVYARFLLSHLSAVPEVLRGFHQHLRPGGWLVLEDIDASGHVAWPPHPAIDCYRHWLVQTMRHGGGDANIGPRLPALLQQAGFDALQVRVVQPVALQGEAKQLAAATIAAMSAAICAQGLATAAEVQTEVQALQHLADDPHTLMGTPRVFQVWGRRAAPN